MIGPRQIPEGTATVVGRDAVMQGELECGSGARIEGTFEGRIEAAGAVEIDAAGRVKADIEAATVAVRGRLEGSLHARERAHLGAGCRVSGVVVAGRLRVDEGAELSLRVEAGAERAAAGRDLRKQLRAELAAPTNRLPG